MQRTVHKVRVLHLHQRQLLVKSSSLGQDLPEITDRDVKPTTTSTLEATALPPEDGMFKGSDGYPTRSENVTPFGEDFTNSRNLETAATKSFFDFPDDSSFGLDSFFYQFYSENDYTKRPITDGLLPKGSGTILTGTDLGEKLEPGENNGVTSSGMEESLLPESIDRRTSKPRGTTVEVQMRPTGRPFVQKEGEEEEEDGDHFRTEEMSTAAGSTVEAKGDVVKNTNIGEENSQDKERGDGDISRSEGEETTSMTVVPQLKFEDAPETEQFAAVTLGIHLAELVDPSRSNLTIDNKISSKTGNTTGGKLNIDVADRNLIPNYQVPISNTQDRGGKDPSVQDQDRDGHVPPTESTTERDLAKSTSLMRNGSTAGKKDLTTTRRTTTTTRIVEEQKSTAKITTTGDELVTTGKRLVTTATVLTTVLPTTQSSKSTTTSPSTSEDITTSPAMQTTTVAVTTTPKSSTATLPTTPPVTTTAAVTMTAAVRTTEDNEIVPITERPEYIWRVTGHSTCQVTCGRGIRMEYAYCVNREDAIVADNLCNPQTKPEVIPRTCVNERCEARWEIGAWSSCSVSCGVA
ncbi:putative ADAMTS-like protein 2 isoform X1 [Apostichopus japonicus]|uniref:Putative ADAMTS-like protein 2 isoform X1 n=1 Tax=Stichopus japonicus TaxID=307972 RepID=A0A2G8JFS1_STIJA|nr:putative ADAMTS-like protein 2 isoform X1 [Apostichopus japonicus]